jgi:hypothetical protein
MSRSDWEIRGPSVNLCNCAWGCPCQFNSLPTQGDCRAVMAMKIEYGRFGDLSLDDTSWAMLFAWPGAVHQGDGEMQIVHDRDSSAEQRVALGAILNGEHTEPGATIFNVFAATYAQVHEPTLGRIELDFDIASRRGRVEIPELLEASVTPIRNPVTGAEHSARVHLPHGFEYTEAEYCSGSVRATGAIEHDWQSRHCHLQEMHMAATGPVR